MVLGLPATARPEPNVRAVGRPRFRINVPRGIERATIRGVTLGGLAMSLLRFPYRLLRVPLQLVEVIAQSHLDEQAPTRRVYERFLIAGDRAAAYLLDDENAARRAVALTRHIVAVHLLIAREHQRIRHRGLLLLDEQRDRFYARRHHRPNGHAPT